MDMPSELLRCICLLLYRDDYDQDYAAYQVDKGALCNLSKTCKRFHAIAQPILFRSFVFHGQRSAVDLLRFLRSLGNNALLSRRVKILEFGHRVNNMRWDLEYDKPEFRSLCYDAGPGHFLKDENYGLAGVELALLHTPKLQTLRLPPMGRWPTLTILPYLSLAGALLPDLHTVHISEGRGLFTPYGTDALLLVPYLARQSPNLRSLTMPTPSTPIGDFTQPLPLLHSLTLGPNCQTPTKLITELITMSPVLRVFRLHSAGGSMTTASIWEAVTTRSDTLEELSLFMEYIIGRNNPDWEPLSEFPKLKVLRLSIAFAEVLRKARQDWLQRRGETGNSDFLVRLLPPGIEEVVLWHMDSSSMTWVGLVQELGQAVMSGRFEHLNEFTVMPRPPYSGTPARAVGSGNSPLGSEHNLPWNLAGSKLVFSEERGLEKIRLCWGEVIITGRAPAWGG